MRQTLRLHPDSSCLAVTHIEVEVARPRERSLVFAYAVTGRISDLAIPAVVTAARNGELWRHTCFEAFVASPPDVAYYEFNFAPSTQWAAYRFTCHRDGMHVATEVDGPAIEVHSAPGRYTLQASLDLQGLSGLPRDVGWRLGLAAIAEDTRGGKSYWALAHPPGKPDFHHFDCFAHELSAA